MMTNLSMDVTTFLRQTLAGMQHDVNSAYDGGYLDDDKANNALHRIESKIETLNAFLNSVEAPNASPANQGK